VLTTADTSALVGTATSPMATKHVLVVRPFYHLGVVRQSGDVLEVAAPFAAELVGYRKASYTTPPAPPPAPVVIAADEDVKPEPKKVKFNARK
jgi:hypothetical protein